jgi:hypothetical protein
VTASRTFTDRCLYSMIGIVARFNLLSSYVQVDPAVVYILGNFGNGRA